MSNRRRRENTKRLGVIETEQQGFSGVESSTSKTSNLGWDFNVNTISNVEQQSLPAIKPWKRDYKSTLKDKAHCPFHLKTGACRFGSRCSRVHFYPDKSCTLLIKNMYNGPGLAWELDEGLEVCKNGSTHLRGNVYIHYKSLDSALLAYEAIKGRYFAGKQVTCEFIGVTKWKVAICGESMKSRLKTCSRGTACNFIHCFRNPGGNYEWADMDQPPPTYWVKKMVALFGYSEESGYDNHMEHEGRSSSRMMTADSRYNSRRSLSRERNYCRSCYEEYDARSSRHWDSSIITRKSKKWTHDSDSDSDEGRGGDRHQSSTRNGIRNQIEVLETQDFHEGNIRGWDSDGRQLDMDIDRRERDHGSTRESSSRRKKVYGVPDDYNSENRTHGANSGGHPSDNERDTDRYRD